MKFPKLCAVHTLLYFFVCLFSISLYSQIATPTFETSHGIGPNITICEDTAVTFLSQMFLRVPFIVFTVSQKGEAHKS